MMISRFPFEFSLHLVSMALAILAAWFAIYLIPVAGKARAWLAFAGACALLAVDRVLETLSYSGILQLGDYPEMHDVLDALMAGCLFFAVYFIRNIFFERSEVQRKLEQRMDELQRFQQVAIGRELRMKELYQENQALKVRLGEPDHG